MLVHSTVLLPVIVARTGNVARHLDPERIQFFGDQAALFVLLFALPQLHVKTGIIRHESVVPGNNGDNNNGGNKWRQQQRRQQMETTNGDNNNGDNNNGDNIVSRGYDRIVLGCFFNVLGCVSTFGN